MFRYKIFGRKNVLLKKYFVRKNVLVEKMFLYKKHPIVKKKTFWYRMKNFSVEKIFL